MMRRTLFFATVVAGALTSCGGSDLPKTVDPHWLARCEGTGTNVYGLTRIHACMAAAKGYENDGDELTAATFYRHACDLGDGEACIDWSTAIHDRGNIVGARIALESPACDDAKYAGLCGWALIASFERDEPRRPDQVRPILGRLCDAHHVRSACARLRQLPDEDADASAPTSAEAGADGAAGDAADAGETRDAGDAATQVRDASRE